MKILLALLILSATNCLAGVSIKATTGLYSVTTDQLIYSGDKVLSELVWDADSVQMIGVALDSKYIGGSFRAGGNSAGAMVDTDWIFSTPDWSDKAFFNDVQVDISIFDLHAKYPKQLSKQVTIYPMIGYQRLSTDFVASVGSYTGSWYGYRDITIEFDGSEPVISYEQTVKTPYIGAGFSAELMPLSIKMEIIGSTFVSVDATDTHHLRDLQWSSSGGGGNMIGVVVNAEFAVTDTFTLGGSSEYQSYSDIETNLYYGNNKPGNGGFNMEIFGLSAKVKYNF